MKRTLPLLVLIGAVGLLIPVLAVFGKPPSAPKAEPHGYYNGTAPGVAEPPPVRYPPTTEAPIYQSAPFPGPTAPSACMPCCSPASGTSAATGEEQIINELTAILKETKSQETFAVTAWALARMGPNAKRALPVIIRNAERLELFDSLANANDRTENRAAQEVIASLELMLDKKKGAKSLIGAASAPVCYPSSPATSYSPPVRSAAPPTPVYAPTPVPPPPPSTEVPTANDAKTPF